MLPGAAAPVNSVNRPNRAARCLNIARASKWMQRSGHADGRRAAAGVDPIQCRPFAYRNECGARTGLRAREQEVLMNGRVWMNRGPAALVFGLFALGAGLSFATSIVPITDLELHARADAIVHGVVVSNSVGADALGRPETVTRIAPLAVLKGKVSADLVIHQLGGALPDGRFFKLWGRPEYQEGHEVVVFRDRAPRRGLPDRGAVARQIRGPAGRARAKLRRAGARSRHIRSGRHNAAQSR